MGIIKPFGKIEKASAIFWNYRGMFREYGPKDNFFRSKKFLFFKIESWSFQNLFENEFCETSQSFNTFIKLLLTFFSLGCLIELKFREVSRNSFSNRSWKFQLFMLKNKKSFIPPKKYFFGCSQYQNKKALFTDSIFLKVLGIISPDWNQIRLLICQKWLGPVCPHTFRRP